MDTHDIPAAMRDALAAYRGGEAGEAERLAEQVATADPANFEAHHLLAVLRAQGGRQAEALASYDAALALRPDDVQALSNQSVTLDALGRWQEALASCQRALERQPDYVPALSNRGNALRALKRFEEALASYDAALALAPDFPEALSNRGTALHELGHYDEALDSYDRALAARPAYPHALSNRGLALERTGRFAEALASYDKALVLQPNYQECHSNRALLLLRLGCFAEAWGEYEWRRRGTAWRQRDLPGAEWQGESLRRKRLLLYAEQGLGDTIQFARFAAEFAARGARVIVEVQPPLATLMQGLAGARQVVCRGDQLPEFDLHLPLLSAPFALGIDEAGIPREVPYLAADRRRVAAWQKRLPQAEFRIGLAWQGNPGATVDRGRSLPLAAFAPLARLPGVRLISLQKENGIEQLDELPPDMRVASLGEEFDAGPDGFLDTAAVMMHLDLVIAIDGAVAHLAGALGRPVWILLQQVADWRWLLGRNDSPWYPTARLFRQRRSGDWQEVMARVTAELAPLVAAKPPGAPAAVAPAVTIPAYVISLARRADRRDRFMRWNSYKGIDFAMFDAVEGQTLDRRQLFDARLIDDENLKFTSGFLGSALSHRALWELCLDLKRPILVFEDDILLPDGLQEWFETILAEVNGACDILYLGYNRDAVMSLGYAGGEWCTIAFDPPSADFDSEALRHGRWSRRGAHCILDMRLGWGIPAYAIAPHGAAALLRHCFPLTAKHPVQMFGLNRALIPYGLDGIINAVVQRGLVKARAVFPPLVIGPNEQADSDNIAKR